MNPSFRSLVIDLLDNPNGIPQSTFESLMAFGTRNYPEQCDDIWPMTDCAESSVWLNEEDAEELRLK
jgi:hypothetical protein